MFDRRKRHQAVNYIFMSIKLIVLTTCLIALCSCSEIASEDTGIAVSQLPYATISLDDLKGFRDPDQKSWQIAGEVYANRNKEHHLETSGGTGILVNQPEEDNKKNLFTSFDHGDIDLELDFLMPKGSNSGVYLQGRYEVQLLDSWLKDSVAYGDCGGIYQRWSDDQGFEGKAPLLNACKAPGLWQHLSIRFKAPQFDESGKKIRSARFDQVVLNAEVIQQDVEVSGPTRSAAFEDEKPKGPLMLQGDHGPVAFRHIRYKLYGDDLIEAKNVEYQVFKGVFTNIDTLQTLTPATTHTTDSISYRVTDESDRYTLVFNGTLEIPQDGNYLFKVQAGGPSWFRLDNDVLADNDAAENFEHAGYGTKNLKKGTYPFALIYVNSVPWRKALALSYEGPEIPLTPLTTAASAPQDRNEESVLIKVARKPVLQRGFIHHGDNKLTHTVAIGMPEHINYAYDLKNNGMVNAWRGHFLDATEMWVDRGEKQLEVPLGAVLTLPDLPAVAALRQKNDPWPDSVSLESKEITNKGHKLRKNGLPVFFYTLNQVSVEDYLYPASGNQGLSREISFHFEQPDSPLYCLLASGSLIEKLPDGSYAIDDLRYYIEAIESGKEQPIVREQAGKYELLVPVVPQNQQALVKYSIIW